MLRPGNDTRGTGDAGHSAIIDDPDAEVTLADNQTMREGILDRAEPQRPDSNKEEAERLAREVAAEKPAPAAPAGKTEDAAPASAPPARAPRAGGQAGRPASAEEEEQEAIPTDEEDLQALNLRRRLKEIEEAGLPTAGEATRAAPPSAGLPVEVQESIRELVRDPVFDPEHLKALVDAAQDADQWPMEALVYMAGVQEARFKNLIQQAIDTKMQDAASGLQRSFEDTYAVRNALELLYTNFPALRERVAGRGSMQRLVGEIANEVVDEINEANKTDFKDAEEYILTAYRQQRYDLIERFINRTGRRAQADLGVSGQSNGRGSASGSKPAARSAGRVAERPTGRMPGQSGSGPPQDDAEREKRRTLMDNIGVRPIR